MAYYLTINKNKDYKKIDISLLSEFERKSNFKNLSYSLEEIDLFTSKFEDEVSLKRELYKNDLIELDDITKELSIRMSNKGKLEKVMYGIVFREQRRYLDDEYLRKKILSLQNDKVFLEKLVARYRNSYCNNITIARVRNCLYSDFYDDLYSILSEFVFREIYSDLIKETGEVKLKYRSLHDLAMFVYNYVNNKKIEELGSSISTENNTKKKKLYELQKSILLSKSSQECKVNSKKKVLKKEQVEGQISLFDNNIEI